MKKIIATIMTLALVLGLCSATAFAADDIVLDGDQGESSLIKEFSASGGEYKYLGYATTKEATSDYKYLQLTYTGDISMFRIEMNTAEDTNKGPYWFAADQFMKFVTADGSAIPTNVTSPTTIIIDLEASGINIGDYVGMHLHYLSPDIQSASFTISDARLMTSTTSSPAGSGAPAGDAPAGDAPATQPSTQAPATGSTAVPTVIACLVVLCAGAVLVFNKKRA